MTDTSEHDTHLEGLQTGVPVHCERLVSLLTKLWRQK